MGAELVLFGIVGIVAIVCAAAMLLSENAVHSALFLIVNFICVAFLYIMLEAPFLAMVQIAVYAGAIMVLFLFVVMLLGAEKLSVSAGIRQFPWLAPLALALALVFILATSIAVMQGNIDTQSAPSNQALLRFVNAAAVVAEQPPADANVAQIAIAERNFDVYINGELFAESVAPEDVVPYQAVTPGDYTVAFNPTGTAVNFVTATLSLEAGQAVTAVLMSDGGTGLSVASTVDDLSATDRRNGRVAVFNAYTEPVSVVAIESELFADSRKVTPVVQEVASGAASDALEISANTYDWTVIRAGAEQAVRDTMNAPSIFARLRDLIVNRETAQLIVIAPSRLIDGSLIAKSINSDALVVGASAAFGSPQSVGQVLFIDFLLPFQLVAVLLLAAMIGVIVLTQREEYVPKPSRALRRKVSRPLSSVIASQTGSDLSAAPRLAGPESQPDEQPEPAGD